MKIDRKTRLAQIREAGQHIINHAESILGDEACRIGLSIEVDFPCGELPTITVRRTSYPADDITKLLRAPDGVDS